MRSFSVLLIFVLACGIICLSKRGALLCLLLGTLYLTQAAGFELGINWFPARLFAIAAFMRVWLKGEFSFGMMQRLDWSVVCLYSFIVIIQVIGPYTESNIIARSLDAFLCYCSFRGLIDDADDVKWLVRTLAIVLVPYVVLLALERFSSHNPFSLVGATKQWVRDDRIRAFGSFQHPSLLGSLGAVFFPLYVALAWDKRERARAFVGAASCVAIVGFSNSGGPIGSLGVAVIGWLAWSMRYRMQLVRRSLVAAVILLALVMKAPVFYLLARGSSVTGGGGWHRAHLIEAALADLDKWWLVGMPVEQTSHWFAHRLLTTGGADITNQFVAFGLAGGLAAVALAVWLFIVAFKQVGKGLAIERGNDLSVPNQEQLIWAVGVVLAVHVVTWLGITYFDQFLVFWCLQLALVPALTGSASRALTAESPEETPWGMPAALTEGRPAL